MENEIIIPTKIVRFRMGEFCFLLNFAKGDSTKIGIPTAENVILNISPKFFVEQNKGISPTNLISHLKWR